MDRLNWLQNQAGHGCKEENPRLLTEMTFFLVTDLYMIFQGITAASMKMRAFWDIPLCSLIGVDRYYPDDRGSTHL
jgi:hypothetical protein